LPGFEADDVLATIATRTVAAGGDCTIATSDKDARQLLGPHVTLLNLRTNQPLGAEAFQTMLSLCDQLRDETLIDLGVRVEDRAEGALWKLDEPEVLRRELQAKQAKQLEDRAIKMLNKLNAKLEALAKAEMAATPPAQVLSLPVHAGKYGPLDAEGKPTTDAAGEPLSKSALKTALAHSLDSLPSMHGLTTAPCFPTGAQQPRAQDGARDDARARQLPKRELGQRRRVGLQDRLSEQAHRDEDRGWLLDAPPLSRAPARAQGTLMTTDGL
jgi:hypothetical protein